MGIPMTAEYRSIHPTSAGTAKLSPTVPQASILSRHPEMRMTPLQFSTTLLLLRAHSVPIFPAILSPLYIAHAEQYKIYTE